MRGINRSLILGALLVLFPRSEIRGQAQATPPTKPFEGCYEVTLGRWWPWSFGADNEFVTPPSQIQLLSEHGRTGFEKDGFLIRAILPRKGGATSGRGEPSYWNVRSANEVDLIWNDGFTGVMLSLKKHGEGLDRWAHPHFDAPKFIPRVAHVTARRIACELPQ